MPQDLLGLGLEYTNTLKIVTAVKPALLLGEMMCLMMCLKIVFLSIPIRPNST